MTGTHIGEALDGSPLLAPPAELARGGVHVQACPDYSATQADRGGGVNEP